MENTSSRQGAWSSHCPWREYHRRAFHHLLPRHIPYLILLETALSVDCFALSRVPCTVYSVQCIVYINAISYCYSVVWPLWIGWSRADLIYQISNPVERQSPSRPVTQSNWRRISYNTVRLRWERKLIDLDPVAAGTIHPRRDRKIVWRIEKENAKEVEEAKDVNARRPKTSQGGKHTMGRIFQWPIVVSWVGRWVGEKGVGLVGFILLIE